MKLRTIRKELPYIVLMLISIALTGVVDLVVAGFDFSTITSATYITKLTITTTSAFLMALSATLMTNDIIELNTNEGLGKQANDLKIAVNSFNLKVKNDIDIFIAEINHSKKVQAWEKKIKRKILKLEKKFTEKDSKDYAKYLELGQEKGKICLANASKIVKKKVDLESKLEKEYIEKNINYIKVKYVKLYRRMLETGTDLNNLEEGQFSKNSSVLIKGLLPKFLYSIAFSLFIVSFSYELAEGITFSVIIPILAKLCVLILNANFGRGFAPNYFSDTTIYNLQVRFQWLTKYIEWHNERQKN